MATLTESAATDALYRALRSPEPDPDLAHAAVEEVRNLASQNVITVIGAQITELRAEMKSENAEIRARMDALQKVIWPLIAILATSVFGLLYKAVTG